MTSPRGPEWIEDWQRLREDPAVSELAIPDLDEMLDICSPRTVGEPALDPDVMEREVDRLATHPEVDTGHELLDLSVKVGLASIDLTFRGDHPRYGAGMYSRPEHEGFPPTIIAAVDALSAWGLTERASRLFEYWLSHFVRADGTIDYYGPSVAEYGQLLHLADVLERRAGPAGWWDSGSAGLSRMAGHLLRLRAEAEGDDGLIPGIPEADESGAPGRYFHNNAWAARGLTSWAELCSRLGAEAGGRVDESRQKAAALAEDTLAAISRTWPAEGGDWWLPPRVEPAERPDSLTATRLASYTNYRYYPELLSSGMLPEPWANRLVDTRLSAGGQLLGMTRFAGWLDDWPLADYLYGVWNLGRRDDFLRSLFGHVAFHQAEGHLTAYEQVTFWPGRQKAPYCLPCQLVAARAARLLVEQGGRDTTAFAAWPLR